ncbi:hypothetical protein ACFY05_31905 [Microtetraspora fusca]|uniref:DUF732 domain-containing protein n=1 Tax=Microtetraspora fusca TaxID=1997 RepID=A0ABW6VDN9_MICFU
MNQATIRAVRRVLAFAAAALALAACSPDPPPQNAHLRDQLAVAGPLSAEDYYRLVREHVPSLANRPDADLDTIGKAACEVLAMRDGWLRMIKVVADEGLSGGEAGHLAVYVVARHCPDRVDSLP